MMASEIPVEVHPFEPFASDNSETLIIGSFPCYNGIDYGNWYYSGSGKNDFWKLLSDIYNMPTNTKEEKQNICTANRIAITDIALSIQRRKDNCSDVNLKIVKYNRAGIESCLSHGISKILFTSRFVEKHFKKEFPYLKTATIALISPSQNANRYIARLDEYKRMIKSKEISSAYEYRKFAYKKALDL